MAHFPATFSVKPYPDRGTVRLSVSTDGVQVSEWWLSRDDVESAIAEGTGWVGEERLQIRLESPSVAFTSAGRRSVVRADKSTVKLLRAHLRAALFELPLVEVNETGDVVSVNGHTNGGLTEADVRRIFREELSILESRLMRVLRTMCKAPVYAPAPETFDVEPSWAPAPRPPAEPEVTVDPPSDPGVFIPSARPVEGTMSVTEQTSDSVADAVRALKERQ